MKTAEDGEPLSQHSTHNIMLQLVTSSKKLLFKKNNLMMEWYDMFEYSGSSASFHPGLYMYMYVFLNDSYCNKIHLRSFSC